MEMITRIVNDELEKFMLNFSRCTNRDVAPLSTTALKGTIRYCAIITWRGGGGWEMEKKAQN